MNIHDHAFLTELRAQIAAKTTTFGLSAKVQAIYAALLRDIDRLIAIVPKPAA